MNSIYLQKGTRFKKAFYRSGKVKKAILMLVIVFIFSPALSSLHSSTKTEKFLEAESGESWMITDEWTFVWDEPDSAYDDWRYIFRNKYSLTWHDFYHVVDSIKRYHFVVVVKTTGYVGRWKYVTYAKTVKGKFRIRNGWILGTTVERAARLKVNIINVSQELCRMSRVYEMLNAETDSACYLK
jgi:hypothetical protein